MKTIVYCAFLVSLLTVLLFVEVTAANPVGMYGKKPKYAIVTIDSPADSSLLSFNIKTNYYWATGSNLTGSHCFVILDSNVYEANNLALVGNTTVRSDFAYDPYLEYRLRETIDLSNITNLLSGMYTVEVNYGYYTSGFVDRRYIVEYVCLGSETSQITVPQQSYPSPSLVLNVITTPPSSQSMPTINTGSIVDFLIQPILFVLTANIVAAAMGLCIYKYLRKTVLMVKKNRNIKVRNACYLSSLRVAGTLQVGATARE